VEKRNQALPAEIGPVAGAVVLFGWLAGAVLRGATMALDGAARNAIHAWASPWLTAAMLAITRLGEPEILIPLGALLVWRLFSTGRQRAAWLFLAAAIGGEALDQTLKLVYHRVRPQAFFGYAQPGGYGFPSGHAMMSCCFYGVAAAILTPRIRRRAGRVLAWTAVGLLAAALGLSRLYLGVHYPSDVLAGYLAGAIWARAVFIGFELRPRRAGPTKGSSRWRRWGRRAAG